MIVLLVLLDSSWPGPSWLVHPFTQGILSALAIYTAMQIYQRSLRGVWLTIRQAIDFPARRRAFWTTTIQQIVHQETQEFRKQFYPNDGHSMRDSIDRLTTAVADIRRTQARVEARTWAMWGLDDADCGRFDTDAQGNLIALTSQILLLVGKQLDDVRNQGWISFIDPSIKRQTIEWWNETYKAGAFGTMEQIYTTPTGRVRVLVTAVPLRDGSGVLIGYTGKIKILERL